ncbi:HNH endonuclease [Sphingomonas aquatilis]
MSGYARFHRSLIGHPAFRNDAEAMAFAYMVLRASWKPVRVRYKGKALSLNRGQLAMSVRDLAEAMDRDKGWVQALLRTLSHAGLIAVEKRSGVAVITVLDFDSYEPTAGEALSSVPALYLPEQSLDVRETIPAALRNAIISEANGRCAYCGGPGPFHIDHIIPWSRGGTTTRDNLACACVRCNLSKGARTPEEWRS